MATHYNVVNIVRRLPRTYTYLCIVVRDCRIKNGGCQQMCHQDWDKVTCSCLEGYKLANDGSSCEGQYCGGGGGVIERYLCFYIFNIFKFSRSVELLRAHLFDSNPCVGS